MLIALVLMFGLAACTVGLTESDVVEIVERHITPGPAGP